MLYIVVSDIPVTGFQLLQDGTLWVSALAAKDFIRTDVVSQRSEKQGVLTVWAEYGTEFSEVFPQQVFRFPCCHIGGVFLSWT